MIPAKVILLGEHAVVHGQPAIAVPFPTLGMEIDLIDSSVTANTELTEQDKKQILEAVKAVTGKEAGVDIHSTIPLSAGLGSSAALSVALARFIGADDIFTAAMDGERIFHGNPSGVDPAVIALNRPIYYVKGQQPQILRLKKPLHLVVADSGERASTKDAVEASSQHENKDEIFAKIGRLSLKGKKLLEDGKLKDFGKLMTENHALLQQLDLSTETLDSLCNAALRAGAFGAKLTGKGRGGVMVALCEDSENVKNALIPLSQAVWTAVIR